MYGAASRVAWLWGPLLTGFALLFALPLGGLVYENIAETVDARRFPPPGELVDIGNRRLHLYCTGSGGPTVVVESGKGSFSVDWALVQPEVSRFTRVCTYDRASYGWSDPDYTPRSFRDMAGELYTLLKKAGVEGPYVLVGHSMGGFLVRLFTERHPELVRGMVLVDSSNENAHSRWPAAFLAPDQPDPHPIAAFLSYQAKYRFGLSRLRKVWLGEEGVPSTFAPLPPHSRLERMALMLRPAALNMEHGEAVPFEASLEQVRAARRRAVHPLADMPLAVVTADPEAIFPGEEPGMRAAREALRGMQADLATLSSKSTLTVAKGSTHFVQIDRPQYVIDAIRSVVNQVKSE